MAAQDESEAFTRIGAGACGAIFAVQGTSTVIKLAKYPDANNDLWNDCQRHMRIAKKLGECNITANNIKVPICWNFRPKTDSVFWKKHATLAEVARDTCHLPTHALCTERIHPLPAPVRQLLIERFCPGHLKENALRDPANKDCLVRVYLGATRDTRSALYFSLRNLKLRLHEMLELKLDVEGLATSMAGTLAVMHWSAKTDARDVEFVLGSSTERVTLPESSKVDAMPPNSVVGPEGVTTEDFYHRKTRLWLLDFNQVRPISMDAEGVALAIQAFMVNDPYYPRPLQQLPAAKALWDRFARSYLSTADSVLRGQSETALGELPRMFLKGVIEAQRVKQARTEEVKQRLQEDGDAE